MPPVILQAFLSFLPLAALSSLSSPPSPDFTPSSSPFLDAWITRQRTYSLEKVWTNIGAAAGAAPGVVIASPSRSDPDYYYTWTRDAALTASGLLSLLPSSSSSSSSDLPDDSENRTLLFFSSYIDAQLALTALPTRSGDVESGDTLGEPKFNVDLSAFKGEWGRPQRDGPALRAKAVMQYLDYLASRPAVVATSPGEEETKEKALKLLRLDVDYTAQNWNRTTFDLWEEVQGSSFFTTTSQLLSLRSGAALFSSLPGATEEDSQRAEKYGREAMKVECFAREYVLGELGEGGRWVTSNMNVENGVKRSGEDANFVLSTLLRPTGLTFPPTCSSLAFTPCSPLSLSTLHRLLTSFSGLYPINSPSPLFHSSPHPSPQLSYSSPSSRTEGKKLDPLLIGRYSSDTYISGNPWFLTTLGAAQQLYLALTAWGKLGEIVVDGDSEAFWEAMLGKEVGRGVYRRREREWGEMRKAVWEYAEGLLELVWRFTPPSGRMDEQIDKFTGEGTSARDLTWSYIAFLTATQARTEYLAAFSSLSSSSSSSSTSSFSSYRGSISASSTTSGKAEELVCPSRQDYNGTMLVSFTIFACTVYGESILLSGSSPSLGSWSLPSAVRLSAKNWTSENPVWTTEGEKVEIEGRTGVEWKAVKVKQDGSIVWEGGENRIFYTSSDGARTIAGVWRD
ncbi:hypothetical protein JCM8547_003357 [Rhodosporidiobolus lusitaniae]